MMMKTTLFRLLFCSILLLQISSNGIYARQTSKDVPTESFAIQAKVDRRVELLSIVARLAGYEEYVRDDFKLYADDVDKYFEKHKEHPVIKFAEKIRSSNGIGFDAVMSMAVHLNPPPALTPRVPFSDQKPDKRWGKETAEQFARLLQQFYKDADCESFFSNHANLYKTAQERFQQLLNKVDFAWYKRFYGEVPSGSFNLYLGLLNGGGNFGPKVIHPDGKEDLYAIIGVWQMDSQGLPKFDDENLPTIIHEYNHSFINHLVYANESQLKTAGEKIRPPVAEKMKKLAYGNWQTILVESLVRAAVVRYLFEHESQLQPPYKELTHQRNIGFLWIHELSALLGTYENSRKQYPTFRSFSPLIIGYFNDFSKRIDYEAQRFEESVPHVAAMSPFANLSQDVDSTITQITFTFDKPLDTKAGVSINYGQSGREHFPVEKGVGYNETGSTYTVQVKLKPDWDYEFVLTGLAFKTKDGYPLQPYTVKFKTKK
jgi:hypothetical protein